MRILVRRKTKWPPSLSGLRSGPEGRLRSFSKWWLKTTRTKTLPTFWSPVSFLEGPKGLDCIGINVFGILLIMILSFGSMVYSHQTGLILNNEMADFCMKQSDRKVYPGEMPPSSMTPSILISRDGDSKLIIGGSGGTLITPAVALAIANKLWFGYNLEGAIRAPILYATKSGSLEVEPNFDQETMAALRQRGHAVKVANYTLNVVQGVSKDGQCIVPYSDRRKNGEASGY